jgi:hypothetical protein
LKEFPVRKEQNFGEKKTSDNCEFYKKRKMKLRKESGTYLRRRRVYTIKYTVTMENL